jgi:hypothetical protein
MRTPYWMSSEVLSALYHIVTRMREAIRLRNACLHPLQVTKATVLLVRHEWQSTWPKCKRGVSEARKEPVSEKKANRCTMEDPSAGLHNDCITSIIS